MERFEHFLHPHKLSFHDNLEGTQLTCSGCKFPCTGTPVYSCHLCNFFLHSQCFNAPRSLIHPSHPDHPLSLFPFPTYTYGSFICNSCNKSGSGFCFCCSTCQFDLHIHCAFNDLKKPKPRLIPSLNQIQLKAHANHPIHYLPKVPNASRSCLRDVCGTYCDPDGPLYHCDICGYDAHVGCTNLPETVQRGDQFECDVCRDFVTPQFLKQRLT